MRELFVYYRVRPADAAAAREAVSTMQNELRSAHPGLAARLLRREDGGAGAETWLETYSVSAGSTGIDAALEARIEARAACLLIFIDGPRHVESFNGDDSK